MKEYLLKTEDGKWIHSSNGESFSYVEKIEIPEGADELLEFLDGIEFYKDNRAYFFDADHSCSWRKPKYEIKTASVLWQREPKYKEFLNANDNYNLVMLPEHAGDDERSGLIEVPEGAMFATGTTDITFRKDYFYYNDILNRWEKTDVTIKAICKGRCFTSLKLAWQRNTEKAEDNCGEVNSVEKHSHYFKDFSDCKKVDVYRVLDRFNVVHPCQQHIAKKALCAGNRGHKDLLRDIQDIIDTAERWKEMLLEDSIID